MSNDSFFDPAALARIHKLGGDNLVSQMAAIFYKNGPDRVSKAREGQEQEDLDAVERAAHSLKSSAGNIGALELMSLSGKIEQLAENRCSEGMADLLDELEEMYPRVEERLRQETRRLSE